MTRRTARRADDRDALAERDAAAAAPPAPPALLELQRSAGNAAVARVLAREPAADAPLQFTKPQSVTGGPNPFLTYRPKLRAGGRDGSRPLADRPGGRDPRFAARRRDLDARGRRPRPPQRAGGRERVGRGDPGARRSTSSA